MNQTIKQKNEKMIKYIICEKYKMHNEKNQKINRTQKMIEKLNNVVKIKKKLKINF